MNIVILLGAPGSGKGTIASGAVSRDSALRHVSSGDLLRGAIAAGTAAGNEAKQYMDKGQLVPNELIAAMIKDVIAATKGDITMLLDGFPRNVAQAEVLEKTGAPIRSAVLVDVPDSIIADRIAGRRTCPKCKAGYHVTSLPEGRGRLRRLRHRARHPQGRQSGDRQGPPRRLSPRDRAADRLLRGEGASPPHRRQPRRRLQHPGVPRCDVNARRPLWYNRPES